MSSSAATPGPQPSSSSKGDSPPSPTDSNPPSADQGKSAPPPSNSNNNSNSDTGNGNNNNSSSSSPPPSPSTPPPSPPPPSKSGSGGGSGSGSDGGSGSESDGGSGGGSPPSESPTAKASPPQSSPPPPPSPPPPSPPPTSSSGSQSPPPRQSSPPPANSKKSPPPSTGSVGSPPPPSSPPNAPEHSNHAPSNPTPSNNGTHASGGAKWSPPPQTTSPPPPSSTPGGNSPPVAFVSPPSKSSVSSSSSPSNSSSQGKTPGSSNSTKSNNTSAGDSVNSGTIVGATVAGVFVIALIAIFFVVRRKRRRRDVYPAHYMPTPHNFPEKADAYFYSQPYAAHSGPVDTYYGSQPQQSPMGNSYGSQRGGNGYGGSDSGVIGGAKSFFTYEEVMEITNGFSRESVIGEGGFGYVYKGKLQDGKEVAVKQLKAGSGQGEREFRAEVEIISRVHHRHLVSLVGYCISEQNRLLLYEFVPNKTLEHHLHGKGLPLLEWDKRVKIAIGAAKGLAYLHEDCHPKIIHRDIKSANILLDDVFEAQVADFGLARLNDTTQTHVSTRVMGTFGYLAPEYASSGKLTDRSDVYSFGVVLLELITGRKPVDTTQPLGEESLVEWARPLLVHSLETGDVSELVDPRLEKHYVESEVFRMIESAAACVRHSAPKRPRMVQVVRALDCEGEMSDLSNGVKVGQSTVYDSGQYNQDIMMFRKMALGGGDSSEFSSGEYSSRVVSQAHSVAGKSQTNSSEFTSGESETQAMNQSGPQGQGRFGGRRL